MRIVKAQATGKKENHSHQFLDTAGEEAVKAGLIHTQWPSAPWKGAAVSVGLACSKVQEFIYQYSQQGGEGK